MIINTNDDLLITKDVLIEYQATVLAEILNLASNSEESKSDCKTIWQLREKYYSTDYRVIDYKAEFDVLNKIRIKYIPTFKNSFLNIKMTND